MKKKLIEVALPLEAINRESAREKSIRHGHPSTVHPWWARRPLATCRTMVFASVVDDPSADPDRFPTIEAQETERARLFALIERLSQWESTTDAHVLEAARAEIRRSLGSDPPPVLDPFCGGGSIPIESQRLGIETYSSDLNPVPVLLTRALTELPWRFRDQAPVNPTDRTRMGAAAAWRGAAGIAADVAFYGRVIRQQAERELSDLYPAVERKGERLPVLAWLWARTIECPNPACGITIPLVSSFALSTKKGAEAYVEPQIDAASRRVSFCVRTGPGETPPTKLGRGARFRCLSCQTVPDEDYVKSQGQTGRMGQQLMAIVASSGRRRLYLSPTPEHEAAATSQAPEYIPEEPLADDPRNLWCVSYGLTTFGDLFTRRQLVTLDVFARAIGALHETVIRDAVDGGLPNDGLPLSDGGKGATAYADAVVTYLGLAQAKLAVFVNALARWRPGEGKSAPAFGRQAIPMVWDFTEINPFAGAGGDWEGVVGGVRSALGRLEPAAHACVAQRDAAASEPLSRRAIVVTDPPYYDNISYADLSDFFYVWLRRILSGRFPDLFSTILTPKSPELVASPHRFEGSKKHAREHFEHGLAAAFGRLVEVQDADFPLVLFYAFKQAEAVDGQAGIASTGWETMLEGLLRAGLMVTGTWPSRTEGSTRMIAMGTNALASSIVLVCRRRAEDASLATRKEFVSALRRELPEALRQLQLGNIAPVDLAQAAIGPGMAVFSRYRRVIEADGSPMSVRAALTLINQVLDELLAEQEGDFDAETRWAVAWFEQFGMNDGDFGVAETLSKAKNTAPNALVEAGLLQSRAGKVRLLDRDEFPDDWTPEGDDRITVWEICQHLIRRLETAGEADASTVLRSVGGLGDAARELAYRLYAICERKGWANEAAAYNSLVIAWPELGRLAGTPQAEAQLEF